MERLSSRGIGLSTADPSGVTGELFYLLICVDCVTSTSLDKETAYGNDG